MRKLMDSKSLEVDDLDNLPNCKSCLKWKMTKKSFVGQSVLANGLLDLIHTDVCGPLNTPIRGGYSYFITFTDDHVRYDYVNLMRTPHLNGVAERRNRTLLNMVQSMTSFTEMPPSLWGYTLEMPAKLHNIAPSKTVPQTPYEIWHGKPASYKYLGVWGSPAFVKRLVGDKLESKFSLCRFVGYPKETAGYYFCDPSEQKVFILRNVMFLEKGFLWIADVMRTYEEAMSDIDSDKWLEAMRSEMDSMGSNQLWTLVNPPKGVKPVGCK
ncbi:UNVERIFIED_CONTAM: Retrovirus-related Pol polyprotein from transposon TNT 1-94 [Sesamum calycinum]|uniref:Retrovirus-related Pol polyprotein from transposon TNT 1-94 n=1 Tax=Sesamum calycinum TaxID=2727403 RepID=A0AAW2J8K5_9LAMI